MATTIDNARIYKGHEVSDREHEAKLVVNLATFGKLTGKDKKKIAEAFDKALVDAVNMQKHGKNVFNYSESEKLAVIASLKEPFNNLMEKGWAGVHSPKTFENALSNLNEAGIAIVYKEFVRGTKHKYEKKHFALMSKAGFKEANYFIIDVDEFTKQLSTEILKLDATELKDTLKWLTRLFNDNGIANFRYILDNIRNEKYALLRRET